MERARQGKITYFQETGQQNTGEVVRLAVERLAAGDIAAVVVATTTGVSALAVAKAVPKGTRVYAVNHLPSTRVEAAIRDQARAAGAVFIPDEPAVKGLKHIEGHSPDTLRRFGQGMKVAVEVVMQATEAGLVKAGERVIGLGGTSRGVDVAAVIVAAGPQGFGEIWVSEILAKPL